MRYGSTRGLLASRTFLSRLAFFRVSRARSLNEFRFNLDDVENFMTKKLLSQKAQIFLVLRIFPFGFFVHTLYIVIDVLNCRNCQDGCPPLFYRQITVRAHVSRRKIKARLEKASNFTKKVCCENYGQAAVSASSSLNEADVMRTFRGQPQFPEATLFSSHGGGGYNTYKNGVQYAANNLAQISTSVTIGFAVFAQHADAARVQKRHRKHLRGARQNYFDFARIYSRSYGIYVF